MMKFVVPFLLCLVVAISGPLLINYQSSLKNDAAMAQMKTGENAVLERTFIQSDMYPYIGITQTVLILGIAWAAFTRQKKNEKS